MSLIIIINKTKARNRVKARVNCFDQYSVLAVQLFSVGLNKGFMHLVIYIKRHGICLNTSVIGQDAILGYL